MFAACRVLVDAVGSLTEIANPKLTQAALDSFVTQLDSQPGQCLGGWDVCSCFEFLPW